MHTIMIFACAQPMGTSWSCLLGSTRTLPRKNIYSSQTQVSLFLHAHNPWVQADPASWDQLVPCPRKIKIPHEPRSHNFCMRTTHGLWDLSLCRIFFRGAGYELVPGGRISLYPWVVHIQRIMRPWFVSNLFFFGAWCELIPGGRISSYPWVV